MDSLLHLKCSVFSLYTADEDVLRWEQIGHHEHARPPGGSRLSSKEKEQVDEQIARNPNASVHQLRTGNGLPGSMPLGAITPSLTNPAKASYEVEKSKIRQGLRGTSAKNAFALFPGIEELKKKVDGQFFIGSGLIDPGFISIQTGFMYEVLRSAIADWTIGVPEPVGAVASRHGFVTDGDHTYFKFGTLITTCVFDVTMNAWAPVLYTWLHHLDKDHYRAHFRHLNQAIIKAAGVRFEPKMLSGVRHMVLYHKITYIN